MAPPTDNVDRVRDLYDDGCDPSFRAVVAALSPGSADELASLIETDGRLRLALGRDVTLDRYLEVEEVEERGVTLDAAIEMALRSASRSSVPGRRDVEAMVRNYPRLERLIREAADLAATLGSTTSIRRGASNAEYLRRLPFALGPLLADGRPRYELLELVGEGGTGTVYRAVDRNLSDDGAAATVAVKIFSPPSDPALAAWMRDEALKARRVVHENVVRALDRGDMEGGSSYIVYEFVEGGDLGDRIRLEGLPMHAQSATRLIASVARGVHAIHSAGLVHCDLKPGNIAIGADGRPKVADFGIAMREGHPLEIELSDSGSPVGTLAFISPEQFRRDPGAYSFPSDIYSLGAMLAFLVSGRTPYGKGPLKRHSGLRVPGRVELDRSFDADLRRIVARATAPEPGDRYASASELADDLDRWGHRQPLPWGRTGPRRRVVLFVRRRPLLAAVAAIAMLGVVVATGIKVREDIRRNEASRLLLGALDYLARTDVGGENLPVLSMWENLSSTEYFKDTPLSRDKDQIEILRKLLALPDVAEQPHGFDALIIQSALALALVSREGDYLEAEPLARDCRRRWAERFGEDDAMVRRMEVVEAAAATERYLAAQSRGVAPDQQALDTTVACLREAAAELPARDAKGPLPKLVNAQLAKLDRMLAAR